jgi:hypothetical protein
MGHTRGGGEEDSGSEGWSVGSPEKKQPKTRARRQKGGIGKGSQSRAESAKAGAAAAGKRKRGAAAAVDSSGADSADEQESQQRIRLNAQQKTDLIKLIVEKKKSKEGLSTAGQWRAFEALHGESFGGAKLKKFWDTLHRNWKTVNDYHNSTGAGLWWDVKKEDRGAFADKQGIPKELYDFVTPFMQDSAIAAPQATVQSGAPAAAAAHTDNEDKDGGGPQGDAGVLVGSTSSTVGATEVADCVQLYMG